MYTTSSARIAFDARRRSMVCCNLYQGETACVPWLAVPWIVNAFTDDLQYAKRYKSFK